MTDSLVVSIDTGALDRLHNVLAAMGRGADGAIARAVNHTGDKAKTAVKRALVAQTGMRPGTITAFLKVTRASATKGSSAYILSGRGGNISLKYFGARETQAGVSAAPLGARQIYAGTFMRAGRFPNRVLKPNWNGQVFRRAGGKTRKGKDKLEKVRSGVFLPDQLVSGASAEAFRVVVATDLPARLDHELRRVLAGQAG